MHPCTLSYTQVSFLEHPNHKGDVSGRRQHLLLRSLFLGIVTIGLRQAYHMQTHRLQVQPHQPHSCRGKAACNGNGVDEEMRSKSE